jgi:hypothetical protein
MCWLSSPALGCAIALPDAATTAMTENAIADLRISTP